MQNKLFAYIMFMKVKIELKQRRHTVLIMLYM